MPTQTLNDADDDSKNIGDQAWADELAKLKAPDSLEGQGLDEEIAREQARLKAATSSGDSDEPPSGWLNGRFGKAFKKNGASFGIIGGVITSFIGTSMLMAPGSILVTLQKTMENDASDSARTNIVMRRAYVGGLFSNKACKTAACDKLTKMSESQKAKWEKQGFKIEPGEVKNGRFTVKSITFPDGQVARSAADFDKIAKNSIQGRLSADKVVNIRSAFFQNSKFKKVLDKFQIAKSKVIKSSNKKDKAEQTKDINASVDENSKAVTGDTEDERLGKYKQATVESSKFKGAIDKLKSGLGSKWTQSLNIATSAACAAYNVSRIAVATVKTKYWYDIANYAYPFLQAGAQVQLFGKIDPPVVENLANRLTWYDNKKTLSQDAPLLGLKAGDPNPKYSLTALDSQGLQMAIYGDFSKLQDFVKQYTTGALGATMSANAIIKSIQDVVGKDNIHNICVANSYIGMASIALCASPIQALICAGGAIVLAASAPYVIDKAVEILTEPALQFLAKTNLNSNLRGVDLGNALAAGIGLLLMRSSMGYGLLMAANTVDVNNFITATDNDYYQYGEELARYEARSTPFDTTNQYSFMGQIVSAFNPYRSNDGTLFSQLANGFAVVTSPLSKMSTASALYSQPSNMTIKPGSAENRLNKQYVSNSEVAEGSPVSDAHDPDLQNIGVNVNDWSGRPVFITTPTVLEKMDKQSKGQNTAIGDAVDRLNELKQINDDGSPVPDSDYAKFKQYWTEEREEYPGTTTKSVLDGEDKDEGWFTAEKLVYKKDRDPKEAELLDLFQIMLNQCEGQYPTAESDVGDDGSASDCTKETQTKTADDGTWVMPTGGVCTSPYGQRWGKLHAGIDIAPSAGTPIVAPTDMTIIYTKSVGGVGAGTDDGYGNSVVARAVNGEKYMFRFGHMIAPSSVSAGQTVKKGTVIGAVGSTGDSTGPHLHFEIYDPSSPDGAYASNGKPIDPVPILTQHGAAISC